MMTGLHGIVLGGMGLILWVLLRARKGEFSASTTRRWKASGCSGILSI